MAVTVDDVAQYVTGKAPTDANRVQMTDLAAWTQAVVDRYLDGSPCPDDVRNAAVRRVAYYDWHSRLSRRPADGGQLDARFRRDAPLSPLKASGAAALLSPWKRRSVGVAS